MNDSQKDMQYLKTLTLLYVEDDADTREQFTCYLSRLAGTLLTACDGAQGLQLWHEHHPDIIITDIQMPVMDGLAMTQAIREDDKQVPVIVLTAFEQVEFLKRAINAGVAKYVTKPVDSGQLQTAIQECAHALMADQALQSAATRDALTGLSNRFELINRFRAEKSRAERHATPLSLIMADIDHFKHINDTFGHLAGDQILREVANCLSYHIRAEDVCGRWGGEEFLLLLPRISLEEAAVVAEKLRSEVEAMTTEWEGKTLSVTISLGVGTFTSGMGMEQCIEPADEALYRAKQSGRNRFELARY